MIFVTVGTQLPFDRLITAMDDWSKRHPQTEVFAQIGNSSAVPMHMKWAKHLDPDDFHQKSTAATRIVSHAGVGSVLLASELQKPLIIMPRRADLKEHRNDHQLATAKWLEGKAGITVVQDASALDQALAASETPGKTTGFGLYASPELLGAVRDFINQA